MRRENVIGVTAVAIVVVSIRPVRQMVKSLFRRVFVIPFSSFKAVMSEVPSGILQDQSYQQNGTRCCTCRAHRHPTVRRDHENRASPSVSVQFVLTEDSRSRFEPTPYDERSRRLSQNEPRNGIEGFGCINLVNAEPRSNLGMESSSSSTRSVQAQSQSPMDANMSSNLEYTGDPNDGPTLMMNRGDMASSAPFQQRPDLDGNSSSPGPSSPESTSDQSHEFVSVRVRGEWRGRGRSRGRGSGRRGRGSGRGRGRGRGKDNGSANTRFSDTVGSHHDLGDVQIDEDKDGLVTCVRCGVRGHYAGECERPFGPVRRTWPIGLKALARRLRIQAEEPIVWCD